MSEKEDNIMNDIKNPYKMNIIIGVGAIIVGILLLLIPNMIPDVKAYEFYFIFFGIALIVFGCCYFYYYNKRSKKFRDFLNSDQEKLVWKYEDEDYYLSFVDELDSIQSKQIFKRVLLFAGIIVVLSIALYFTLEPTQRFIAILFALIFIGVIFVFTVLLPQGFKISAQRKPYYTIIAQNEAYIYGRYHSWDRCHVKLKYHEGETENYHVLGVNYEAFTANGRLFREWSALLPDSSDETIKEAKDMASKINQATRIYEAQQREDFMEKLFNKMMGRKSKEEK